MTSDASAQRALAESFLALHRGPRILVLPNAWDAASARIYEAAGFPSVATTSAGIAFALGFADGQRLPFAQMIDAIARIVAAVGTPVTADIESGFAQTPEATAENCRAVLAAGAVGVNLEDAAQDSSSTLVDSALHGEKVRAVREAALAEGIPLVINARTDVYLRAVGAAATRLPEALRRANAYREAGADCLFVPGVSDAQTIAALAREIDGPINILAGPSAPPVGELERLGVARVSLGSGPMRATLAFLRRLASEIQSTGTYRMLQDAIPYDEVNRLIQRTP